MRRLAKDPWRRALIGIVDDRMPAWEIRSRLLSSAIAQQWFSINGRDMKDPRITRLAETLVDHSCQVKQHEKVLIEAFDLPDPALVCALVDLVTRRGGLPLVTGSPTPCCAACTRMRLKRI